MGSGAANIEPKKTHAARVGTRPFQLRNSRIASIKALSGVTPNAQSGALKLVGNEFEVGNGETEASIG